MKRRLGTIVLFLVLGAITTILLSWMFALVGSGERTQFRYSTGLNPAGFPWPVEVADDWPDDANASEHGGGRGVYFDHASAVGDARWVYEVLSTRFGWPLPAMQYRWEAVTTAGGDRTVHQMPSVPLPNWLDDQLAAWTPAFHAKRRLPLIPDVPGFAISSFLFAILLWVVLRLRKTVRKAVRRRRHQCIACAYPIGDSPVCTECGAALSIMS